MLEYKLYSSVQIQETELVPYVVKFKLETNDRTFMERVINLSKYHARFGIKWKKRFKISFSPFSVKKYWSMKAHFFPNFTGIDLEDLFRIDGYPRKLKELFEGGIPFPNKEEADLFVASITEHIENFLDEQAEIYLDLKAKSLTV